MILTSRFPYPLEKGDKLRAYYQIKVLAEHFDVYLISLSEIEVKENWRNELEKYCKDINTFKISWFSKWFFAAIQIFSNKPYQVGYFFNPVINKNIKKLLHEINPDHIYCQLIRTTEYAKNYHQCTKTIDYMDALSKGVERRIKEAGVFQKIIFKQEQKRLHSYENTIFEYFEHHTIISEQDQKYIFHKNKENIKVVPNGVAEHYFKELDLPKTYDLIFTGNMSYPPNIEAVKFLTQKILPHLKKETKLLISGASPTSEVKSLQNEQVTISGWVEDIRTSYASGKIFVAPMFMGTGLQNKLLESMASGIPSITTSLANNALGAQENKAILIAETPEEFINHINHLLEDPIFYKEIATNGKAFVRKNFDWANTTQKLIDLINV